MFFLCFFLNTDCVNVYVWCIFYELSCSLNAKFSVSSNYSAYLLKAILFMFYVDSALEFILFWRSFLVLPFVFPSVYLWYVCSHGYCLIACTEFIHLLSTSVNYNDYGCYHNLLGICCVVALCTRCSYKLVGLVGCRGVVDFFCIAILAYGFILWLPWFLNFLCFFFFLMVAQEQTQASLRSTETHFTTIDPGYQEVCILFSRSYCFRFF